MKPRSITKGDFNQIVEVIDRWWGGPIGTFAHPIFFYELGENALVVEESREMVGFLLGFISREPVLTGYVHLAAVHPDFRGRGIGRLLYTTFTDNCRGAGCQRIKAIAPPGNDATRAFHRALGWDEREVDNYAGPGRKRLVFTKDALAR